MPVPRIARDASPRLVLRPGAHVVRRDDDHLQVGLEPPHRAILRDTPTVRAVLAALGGPLGLRLDPAHDGDPRRVDVIRVLDAAELVLDAAVVHRHRQSFGEVVSRAAFARHGADAARRLDERRGRVVAVHAPEAEATTLVELLRGAGVEAVDAALTATPTARLRVAVSAGPATRVVLDEWMARGTAHLVVAGDRGALSVGPFVEPGVTACQRCVDAHQSTHDPRRPLLIEQLSALPASAPIDPIDPLVCALAQAWVARDVVAYLEGDQPSTWSATIRLGAEPTPMPHRWQRHAACGCAWDALTRVG